MKQLIVALFLILPTIATAQVSEQSADISSKLEKIEKLSIIVKKRLHQEVVDSLSASEREVINERLAAQEEELKRLDKQLREQFNNLDVDAQRDILLRQVKKD